MSIRSRNLLITLSCLGLVAFALRGQGISDTVRTALIAAVFAFLTGLWMRSGKRGDGAAFLLPLACAAQLAYGCHGEGGGYTAELGARVSRSSPPHEQLGRCLQDVAHAVPDQLEVLDTAVRACIDRAFGPQFAAGHIALIPQASSPVPSGTAGLYAKSSDGYPRLVDSSAVEYIAGTSWRLRQSAGAPGGVAEGDIWYDSTAHTFVYRDNSGNVTLANAGSYVTVSGSQTISGAKTFSAAAVFNGAVTLGDAAADAIAVKGALAIDNAANTFATALTTGATANRAVAFPDAAGTVLLDGSSLPAANLTGNVAAARINNALTAPGPIGSGTANTGAFSTLAVAGGVQSGASFYKVCTITSAAAATPVNCLAAADVPSTAAAKLAKWHAYINGSSAWATTASCVIEDTAGNDLVTIAVAAMLGDTFIDDGSSNVTKEARYRIGTGGAADAGLQISCDANGTGSDAVFVLSGSIQ